MTDTQARVLVEAAGAFCSAMLDATFGTRPLLWSLVLGSVVLAGIAGLCFAESKGWRGWLWLTLASGCFGYAAALAPVQSWADTQDNRAGAVQTSLPTDSGSERQ